MTFRLAAACLLLVCLLAAPSAVADTTYSHYDVRGNDPLEVMQAIMGRGLGQNGWHEVASVKPRFHYKFNFDRAGGMCRPANFRIEKHFEVMLPRLANVQSLPAPTRQSWDDFYDYLKWHEEQHREMHLDCLAEAEAEVLALPPQKDCERLKKVVAKIRDRSMKQCSRRHGAFDDQEARVILEQPFMKTALEMARRR